MFLSEILRMETPGQDCNIGDVLGCYNDTVRGLVLPHFQPQTHDKTTHEVCAEACSKINSTVTGIDGGNHCYCGTAHDLASKVASKVALEECSTMACRGDRRETTNCGGENRLIAFKFHCVA
eukprot:COSAG01_NODE_2737_length_7163_cov_3.140572_6_plen_122_part_00